MNLIQVIQKLTCGFCDAFFIGATLFGETLFLTLVFAVVYFAVDKRLGKKLGYALFTSLVFNAGIKELVRSPRPIGQEGIRSIFTETATGYSFPSGHSQSAATLYPVLAQKLKKAWGWVVAAILLLLVGVSRLYLGVHWPRDVLVGWALGLAAAFLLSFLYDGCGNWLALVAVALFPMLFCTRDLAVFQAEGLFLGFCLAVLLEERFVNFTTAVPVGKKILRVAVGLALIAAVKYGVFSWFAKTPGLVFAEYALIALVAFFVYPLIFTKCNF